MCNIAATKRLNGIERIWKQQGRWISFLLLLLQIFFVRLVSAQPSRPPIPVLLGYVYDETNTLSRAQKEILEKKLHGYAESNSIQLLIVICQTLGGYPLSDFAFDVIAENKRDNSRKYKSAVILLSKKERKWYIAFNSGLVPPLTDSIAALIGSKILVPSIRKNDFYGALDKSTYAVIQSVQGRFHVDSSSTRSGRKKAH